MYDPLSIRIKYNENTNGKQKMSIQLFHEKYYSYPRPPSLLFYSGFWVLGFKDSNTLSVDLDIA